MHDLSVWVIIIAPYKYIDTSYIPTCMYTKPLTFDQSYINVYHNYVMFSQLIVGKYETNLSISILQSTKAKDLVRTLRGSPVMKSVSILKKEQMRLNT